MSKTHTDIVIENFNLCIDRVEKSYFSSLIFSIFCALSALHLDPIREVSVPIANIKAPQSTATLITFCAAYILILYSSIINERAKLILMQMRNTKELQIDKMKIYALLTRPSFLTIDFKINRILAIIPGGILTYTFIKSQEHWYFPANILAIILVATPTLILMKSTWNPLGKSGASELGKVPFKNFK